MARNENTLLECGSVQRDEFDVLRSMYDSNELIENSHRNIGEFTNLINSFVLRLVMPSTLLDVSIQVSPAYPILEYPDVFARSDGTLNDKRLNSELRSWLETKDRGGPILMDIILWIQENAESYMSNNNVSPPVSIHEVCVVQKPTTYSRYYIHSHHLYSTVKRADIQKICALNGLGGFDTPGKPAVIIIEGETSACSAFWAQLKTWAWQRIQLRHEETFPHESCCKFLPKKFSELVVQSSDGKMVAAHQADVKRELTDRGLAHVFPILYNL